MAKKKAAKRGAPSKACPKCEKQLHARTGKCDCGYEFPKKEKPAPASAALPGSTATREMFAFTGNLRQELEAERERVESLIAEQKKRLEAIETLLAE